MIFNNKKQDFNFSISNYRVNITDKICYLGYIFTPSGSFKSCVKYLYNKALRAMFSIRSSLRSIPVLPIHTYIRIFDHMVQPILLYGSEVWGPYLLNFNSNNTVETIFKDYKSLYEKIHSKFCKNVLLLHKNASNTGVRCELGRYPISITIIKLVTNYYMSILNRKPGIIHDALDTQRVLDCVSKQPSWFSIIKYVKEKYNWCPEPSPENATPPKFKPNFNLIDKLKNNYRELLPNILENDRKLYFYSLIKKNFGLEKYLKYIQNPFERREITKLRISAHKFPVETGRYTNTEHDLRICPLCTCGVGDEMHYFTVCSHKNISKLRELFINKLININKAYVHLSIENCFIYIMCLHDKSVLYLASKYISDMSEIFNREIMKI